VLVRNPDLLFCWVGRQLLVKELRSGQTVLSSPEIVGLLDLFNRPRARRDVAASFLGYEPKSVLAGIKRLESLGLLLPAKEGRRRTDRIKAWRHNLASAHYHVATRDTRFLRSPAAMDALLRTRLDEGRRPAQFKRYRSRVRVRLPPKTSFLSTEASALRSVLESRRTHREFSRRPVRFEDMAAIVRGTWGQTGWLDAGPIGRLPSKTSPSAGALHPIECYVLAWNVEKLPPGLYHFDVRGNELRRLRSGDFRKEAVKAASGQNWVRGAAFLCVMTAVFQRTLWKYQHEIAYRVIWMDAGHLCQTFDLLATAYGLGPFQTAAIQDSYIEKFIGLDGIKEFPVYLCGAGVPAKKLLWPGKVRSPSPCSRPRR